MMTRRDYGFVSELCEHQKAFDSQLWLALKAHKYRLTSKGDAL